MANRPPCKHLDHDFDPRHDSCLKCGMTREKWRALDVATAAAAPSIAASIHYPDCWDTAAYPTLESALSEVCAAFKCSECGVEWRPAAIAATQPDERAALVALIDEHKAHDGTVDSFELADSLIARATSSQPTRTPIYQIGANAGGGIAWWDVDRDRYEREKKAGYMKTGIVYREES